MRLHLRKLNSKGFAHHLIIPVIAIAVVAGIGAYILTRSKAATVTTTTNGPITLTEYDLTNHISKIFRVDPSSGAKTLMQQSSMNSSIEQLSWSQRGDKYAYTNQIGVYVSGAPDTSAKNVLMEPSTMPCANGRRDNYSAPTFSPDGTQIAFITEYYSASDCNRSFTKISKMNVDGSNKVDIAMTGMDWFQSAILRWTSDSLFYFSGPDGVYTVPVTGGVATKIASFDTANFYYDSLRFAFSYDGSRIVTERPVNGKTEIYTANLDGTNQQVVTQITENGSSNSNFSLGFAPDGKSIVFRGSTDTLPYGLYSASIPTDAAASTIKRIADAPTMLSTVSWQPIVKTTTTTSITTLTPSGNWVFSGGASRGTEGSRNIIKLPIQGATAAAGTKKMSKLADFARANYGKTAQLCVTARATTSTSSQLVLTFNQFAQGTNNVRYFSFPTSYTKRCTSFTVVTKQAYDQTMLSTTDPGFKLRSITDKTKYNIEKVELISL